MLSGNSLRQTVHTHRASVHQAAKLVAALFRIARVTAGLAERNGSLPPGLWLTSPGGWLPRTGTLRSVIEYGLPFSFLISCCRVKRSGRQGFGRQGAHQAATQPDDVQQPAAGVARARLRAHSLPGRLRARGTGPSRQPQRSQSSGIDVSLSAVLYLRLESWTSVRPGYCEGLTSDSSMFLFLFLLLLSSLPCALSCRSAPPYSLARSAGLRTAGRWNLKAPPSVILREARRDNSCLPSASWSTLTTRTPSHDRNSPAASDPQAPRRSQSSGARFTKYLTTVLR